MYAFQVEGDQHSGDDTALNAIALKCMKPGGTTYVSTPISHGGIWGDWHGIVGCSQGSYLVAFRSRDNSMASNGKLKDM